MRIWEKYSLLILINKIEIKSKFNHTLKCLINVYLILLVEYVPFFNLFIMFFCS